jgi:virginiamycin A acetyltransferase
MPSSLFGKVRIRLLDRILAAAERPNRIDPDATVAPGAYIRASSLRGAVRVGEHARLYRVELDGPVSIGRYSSLWGPDIYALAKTDPIEFGNFCSVARNVSVHGYQHDATRVSTHYIGRNLLGRPIEDEIETRGPTRIGHDVWIGAGVHVLAGVSIGTGAVIGAGSVVSRDVPPYAVAVGSPARVVRLRFDEETVERLLASEWWTWSLEEIRIHAALFTERVTPDLLDRQL